MKDFYLEYNLLEKEIDDLFNGLKFDSRVDKENIGWLQDKNSINIIENQLNQMKEKSYMSKKIVLDVLNDADNKYPLNVKFFYMTHVNIVISTMNLFLYNGHEFLKYTPIIRDILIDYINNNNFTYQNDSKEIISSIIKNNKVEEFAERVSTDIPFGSLLKNANDLGNVIQGYIDENKKLCVELYRIEKQDTPYDLSEIEKNSNEMAESEEKKIYSQKDFEKLSNFANKLGEDELNELQNILIQCEFDDKVLSDFASAVNKTVINKNVEDSYMPANTIMMYNTKTSDFYDISMADKNCNKWLSFEKFVDLLNDYKKDNLIVVQAKLPTFKEFEPWENATIKGMFAVAKDNGNKLMDFVTVNVDSIKKIGEGQYNFESIIDKDCYSYKFKTKQNVKIHFNKLEVNEELKSKQGFYANEAQAQKIEATTAKLK